MGTVFTLVGYEGTVMGRSLGVKTYLKLYNGYDFAYKLNDPALVFLPLNENFCYLFALNERFLLDLLLWKVLVMVSFYLQVELTFLFLLSKFIYYLDSMLSFRDITRVMFGKLEMLLLVTLRVLLGPSTYLIS